jgi:peptidylprolyl isomerase
VTFATRPTRGASYRAASRPGVAPRRGTARRVGPLAILAAVLLLPALAACASKVAPDGTAAAPVPTPASTTFPAVANPTDLNAAPVISAGQGTPPDGLEVRDLVVGKGAVAAASSTVTVHYVGVLWRNGKTFDSSRAGGGQPASFPLDQVIPGFAQGVEGMKVGGRRELVIPPHLGYGPQGGSPPTIAKDDTLVFVIDLVGVNPPGSALSPR